MATRNKSISLYRGLLRAGRGFPDYNVRDFVLRRTRDGFQKNRALVGAAIETAIKEGQEQLGIVQRQSTIAGFYKGEPSVMEALEGKAGRRVGKVAGGSVAALGGTVLDDV